MYTIIDEDIKNKTIRHVYLLYGEETYLKRQYRNKLKNALVAPGDTMNFASYEGSDINTKELIDLAETLPFFAEKRLILIENSGFFKNHAEDLAEYLTSLPDTTCFVFVEEEIDKRSKMYKAARKAGSIVEFGRLTDEKLTQWILGRLKKENKKITQQAFDLFFSMTGNDMDTIDQELEKLICYCIGREQILPEDVESICCGQIHDRIFDMVNAIAAKNQKRALRLYYDLLELKVVPLRILFLIARQFHILFQVKSMRMQGLDSSSIAQKMGMKPFAVRQNINQAGSFTIEQLQEAIEDAVAAETDVKTGRMRDQFALELLIVKYSAKKTSPE